VRRGFACAGTQTDGKMSISSRKRRFMAVKAIVVYLERIRDAELRAFPASCETELVASIIDEAVCILEMLH